MTAYNSRQLCYGLCRARIVITVPLHRLVLVGSAVPFMTPAVLFAP